VIEKEEKKVGELIKEEGYSEERATHFSDEKGEGRKKKGGESASEASGEGTNTVDDVRTNEKGSEVVRGGTRAPENDGEERKKGNCRRVFSVRNLCGAFRRTDCAYRGSEKEGRINGPGLKKKFWTRGDEQMEKLRGVKAPRRKKRIAVNSYPMN